MNRAILHIRELKGYNEELEAKRSEKFRDFVFAETQDERIRTLEEFRDLTAQRAPEFVRELERLYGIDAYEEAANDGEE